jgi:hypothetical protein
MFFFKLIKYFIIYIYLILKIRYLKKKLIAITITFMKILDLVNFFFTSYFKSLFIIYYLSF